MFDLQHPPKAAKVKLEELRTEKDEVIAKIGAEYQTNLQKLEHGSQEVFLG